MLDWIDYELLSFQPPIPAEPWEGLLTANKFGPPCLQYDAMVKGEVLGAEDCLHLHVYTPNVSIVGMINQFLILYIYTV